jgi:hypothetical protein
MATLLVALRKPRKSKTPFRKIRKGVTLGYSMRFRLYAAISEYSSPRMAVMHCGTWRKVVRLM